MSEKRRKVPIPLYLFSLVVLAAGAVAAAYVLYIYTPDSKNSQHNVSALPVTASGSARPGERIIHTFSTKELNKSALGKMEAEDEIEAAHDEESEKAFHGSIWVLNVISTREPEKAKYIHEMLINSPYKVYTYKVEAQGNSWYRVRVGFFKTHLEAKKACDVLTKHFQTPEAWIVTAGPLEIDQYYIDTAPNQNNQITNQ